MSKTIRTHTAICVDRSGSMGEGDSKVEAEGGVRGFLAGTPKAVDYGRASGLRTTNYDTRKVGQTNAAYGASAQSVADYYVGETTAVETPESVEGKE